MFFSSFNWQNNKTLHLTRPLRAFIQYKNHRLDLMTGFSQGLGIDHFLKELEGYKVFNHQENPLVIHLMYELGFLISESAFLLNDSDALAIVLEYQKSEFIKVKPKVKNISLKVLERPTWTEYKDAFNHLQEELLNGNGYQFNLTYPYDFHTEDFYSATDIHDLFFSKKNLASFAHASFIGEELILSNSPECLFTIQKDHLYSMPIKGTLRKGEGNLKNQIQKLFSDPKEDSELIMISDLVRNDLNKLTNGLCKVPKIKKALVLNNLIHQYSLLKAKLNNDHTLLDIVTALYPGGSITGAPKINSIRTLGRVERYKRATYTGSTILYWKNHLSASINIRTAQIDIAERIWRYGAGGGITLKSKASNEYIEMESKVESFLTLLRS